jgi:hypothetical protein
MLPVLLALSFLNEGIKIGCDVILGNSIFLETFVHLCRVAERINLYWTHCGIYKDRR